MVERTTAFKRDETNTGVDQPTRTLLLVGSMNVHLGKEEKRKVFLGAVSSLVRVKRGIEQNKKVGLGMEE